MTASKTVQEEPVDKPVTPESDIPWRLRVLAQKSDERMAEMLMDAAKLIEDSLFERHLLATNAAELRSRTEAMRARIEELEKLRDGIEALANLCVKDEEHILDLQENGDRLVRAANGWRDQALEAQAKLAAMRPYLRHKPGCIYWKAKCTLGDQPCDCGYTGLNALLEE